MRFEFFISRRYFKPKPKRTILSLITLLSITGVTIGVSALIVVIGVMSGFESDLKNRIMGIEPHLIIDRVGQPIPNFRQVAALAERTPGVESAWPVEELQVMLRSDGRASGALLKGVDPAAAAKGLRIKSFEKLLPVAAAASGPQSQNNPPPMIMGRDLARSLGLIQGDTVFVISPKGFLAPAGFVPYMKRFEVIDFFQTGMYEYDGSLVFIRLEDAQTLSHARGTASAIEVRVNEIFRTTAVKRQIAARVDETYRIRDWAQLNKNLFSALKLEKAAMFITLTLITLVATFSITSSLVMMVGEKIKDIAILRTLGATTRSIRRIFVLQGVMIAMIGTGMGIFLGTTLCFLQDAYEFIRLPGDVYYITALPVDLKLTDVVLVALSAMLISFLATLYPAQQASRFNPVEVIRYG
ncbi:MAG: lipoprotein-releasing ABC transporter permease subunit [Desulfobacteraceae bacterium]|nr:MAG: lipoprotein-releasing ABC transporter permease subunit [Desulfobacteraceae bacterium]